jgi:hypothetical protein
LVATHSTIGGGFTLFHFQNSRLLARIVGRGSGLYQRSCKNAERVECAGVELKLGSFRKDAKAIIVAYASYCGKRLACSSLGSTVATAMATSDLYELASA